MAATDRPPSRSSLRSLDAANLFLAGALSGFGPYIAVFLAEQKWTQQNIGFVLTAGGLAGLLKISYPVVNCLRHPVEASGGRVRCNYGCDQRADYST